MICLGKLGVDEIWVWFHTDSQFRIWSTTGCRQRSCICELAADRLNLKRFLSFSFSFHSLFLWTPESPWHLLPVHAFFCCYFSWLVQIVATCHNFCFYFNYYLRLNRSGSYLQYSLPHTKTNLIHTTHYKQSDKLLMVWISVERLLPFFWS